VRTNHTYTYLFKIRVIGNAGNHAFAVGFRFFGIGVIILGEFRSLSELRRNTPCFGYGDVSRMALLAPYPLCYLRIV